MKPKNLFISSIALLTFGTGQIYAATSVNCSGCVNTRDIANAAVTSTKIKNSAVTSSKIAKNAVTEDKLSKALRNTIDAYESRIANLEQQIAKGNYLENRPYQFVGFTRNQTAYSTRYADGVEACIQEFGSSATKATTKEMFEAIDTGQFNKSTDNNHYSVAPTEAILVGESFMDRYANILRNPESGICFRPVGIFVECDATVRVACSQRLFFEWRRVRD